MRYRIATTLAALAVAGLTLTACGQSQEEKEAACFEAIKARTEGDTEKPKPCEAIPEDDYNTLVIGWAIENAGLDDLDEHPEDILDYAEDGDVDRDH